MSKTILITGATDGIGLETAKMLASQCHNILLHDRNPKKLEDVKIVITALPNSGRVEGYLADLSNMLEVRELARNIMDKHDDLDVLINNAGVLKTPNATTADGLDIRFAVNTIAPYLLTTELLSLLGSSGRVINLSSAAQSPVDLYTLTGKRKGLESMEAYAQSTSLPLPCGHTVWRSH